MDASETSDTSAVQLSRLQQQAPLLKLAPPARLQRRNPRYTSRSPSAALPERSLAAELPGLPPCGQVACLRASQPQTRDEVRCCRTCALLTATSLLPSELSLEPTCWSKGLQGWREQKQPGPTPLPSWDDAWRKNASPSNVVECQCPGSWCLSPNLFR